MSCLLASGFMILMITLESREIFPYEAVFCCAGAESQRFFNILKICSLQLKTSSADRSCPQPIRMKAIEKTRWGKG